MRPNPTGRVSSTPSSSSPTRSCRSVAQCLIEIDSSKALGGQRHNRRTATRAPAPRQVSSLGLGIIMQGCNIGKIIKGTITGEDEADEARFGNPIFDDEDDAESAVGGNKKGRGD